METGPLWVVSRAAYEESVGRQRFIGLPREEVERLQGTVQIVASEHGKCSDSQWLPLRTYTAVHHNYRWLTTMRPPRALGYGAWLKADGDAPRFLDRTLQDTAYAQVQQRFELPTLTDFRFAGLVADGALVLVYVARLTKRSASPREVTETEYSFCGPQELRMERESFEPTAQALIDNLEGL